MRTKLTLRERFEKEFGKKEATRVVDAASYHEYFGYRSFKQALAIVLGYDCLETYRKHHNFVTPWRKLKAWIKKNAPEV